MIASRVVPRPFSSFTSRIVPSAGPSGTRRDSSRKRCARPMSIRRSSAIPTPCFALVGTIATVVAKSWIRSYPAAGPVRRERDVSRVVDEQEARDLERLSFHQIPADCADRLQRDLRGPDVLGDPPRLAGDDARPSDLVQEGGLPVVHVAEDGDN